MVKLAISAVEQTYISANAGAQHHLPPGCLIVTAAGRDKRYRHMLSLMKRPTEGATHLVALQPGQSTPEQPGNDWVVELSGLRTAVRSAAPTSLSPDERFSLFVDVSCLSRQQLGEIMAAVKDIAADRTVHLELAYSLGRFVPPLDSPPTKVWRIAPVNSSYSGWTDEPGKPVDVVVGLGYEKGKALGAVEYLEPRSTWIFVPRSPEQRYLEKVRQHNKELLRRDQPRQLQYSVLEPLETFYTLLSLVTGIARESRPILLPFGPKLYFALALLVATVVDEASVWFVDGDDPPIPLATLPSDHAVLLSCDLGIAGVEFKR